MKRLKTKQKKRKLLDSEMTDCGEQFHEEGFKSVGFSVN